MSKLQLPRSGGWMLNSVKSTRISRKQIKSSLTSLSYLANSALWQGWGLVSSTAVVNRDGAGEILWSKTDREPRTDEVELFGLSDVPAGVAHHVHRVLHARHPVLGQDHRHQHQQTDQHAGTGFSLAERCVYIFQSDDTQME